MAQDWSPATKRASVQSAVLFACSSVGVPVAFVLSRLGSFTWLAVGTLLALSVWLYRRRRSLRTAFFVSLGFAPIVTALHFEQSVPFGSKVVLGLFVMGFLIFLIGGLATAFWSPYKDDLEDLEYRSE